jgi:plasmid maintenance system antidote protein VapI
MNDAHQYGGNSDGRRRRNRWKMRSRRGSPTPDALALLKPGASCESVARRAGLHRQTVEHLFAGKIDTTSTGTTRKVARALGKPMEEVLTTIERFAVAGERDRARNAAARATGATNATTTDGQTGGAARARHLGPATLTPNS